MRRIIPTRFTSAHAVAGVALFVALGGGAYAATGSPFVGPHGNINTCVPPGGGGVNVWKPGHLCTGGRVGLAFPVVGQPGPTGRTGPTGLTGPTGATGAPNPSATTVDGQTVTKVLLKEPTPASGTTSMALYTGAGLTILANCDSTGAASLQANGPSSADSDLTVSGYDNTSPFIYGSQTSTLGPASVAALGPASAGEATFSYASNGGQTVTGTIGYQRAPSLGTFAGCTFSGSVTAG